MRILIRLLSCVVIVSAAITVWTRAALAFAVGSQLTTACLVIAAAASLCAVITLARTRRRNREPRRPVALSPRQPVSSMTGQGTRRQVPHGARRASRSDLSVMSTEPADR